MVFSFEDNFLFEKFQEFTRKYYKTYPTIEEYLARFQVFKENYHKLVLLSIMKENNVGLSFNAGITKFFDLTFSEFQKTYLNLRVNNFNLKSWFEFLEENEGVYEDDDPVPRTFDWRESGAVNKIKDQGNCGSCWAFSALGNLEGVYKIKHNTLLRFSEQQLVDCDKIDHGCSGGLMENAFAYIRNSGGIELEADYPYIGKDTECKFDISKAKAKITRFVRLNYRDEIKIRQFLVKNGPLAVAINANLLHMYSGGIIDEDTTNCNPTFINHGVTLVGYGWEKNKEYWIVRNSWGENWGEEGYFRVAFGKGTCGINVYVVSAEVE